MGYKEFASNTFWGRFVDNMLFFVFVIFFVSLFDLVIKQFSWEYVLAMMGADLVLSLVFAAFGFSWTKFYYKGLEKKKKK